MIEDDDDDKDKIPRGLVSQRRALFGNGDYRSRIRAESVPPPTSSSSSSSSASLSSPSSSPKKRSKSYSRPTQIRIFRSGMDDPSNYNYSLEPSDSPEIKRITVTRHVTTHITEEPRIVIENARSSSTTTERQLLRRKSPKRVYPIVTVNVSDLPPSFSKPMRIYEPPKDYLFEPIEIPIERTYRLNSIRTSSPKPFETSEDILDRRVKREQPDSYPDDFNEDEDELPKPIENWQQFEYRKKKFSDDLQYDNQNVTTAAIAEECQRMLNELQKTEDKENRIVYGKSLSLVDEEIDKLKKQVAETSDMGVEMPPPTTVLNNKQAVPERTIIPSADSSHIISLKDQSVMYTTGTVARQEALIIRLQKELTDVQRCNHALNSQITSLKSKNESAETKKELKERQKECDNLRKKNQKYEFDKQQWEGNLPVDVQLLISQKRELTTQLNREQTEKQELLEQMNVYIGQLAESAEGDSLREENKYLKKKLQDQEAVTTAEHQRLTNELQKVRENSDVDSQTLRLERKKLQAEVEEVKRELNHKSAAFQSLMLAKQDTSKDEEFRKMSEEVNTLKMAMRKLEREKDEISEELESKLSSERTHIFDQEQAQNEIKRLQEELSEEVKQKSLIEQERKLIESKLIEAKADLDTLNQEAAKRESNSATSGRINDDMLKDRDNQIRMLKERLDKSEADKEELRKDKYTLESTLITKDSKIDKTSLELLAIQSRAQQVEEEKTELENQLKHYEKNLNPQKYEEEIADVKEQLKRAHEHSTFLENNLQKAGDIKKSEIYDREIEELKEENRKLRLTLDEAESLKDQIKRHEEESANLTQSYGEELKRANEHSTLLESRLQKASEQMKEAAQQEIMELKKHNQKLQESLDENVSVKDQIARYQKEIESLTQAERIAREKYQKLESELDDSKNSKVSVADEISTLMNSSNSLRKQIDEMNVEIRNLEKEKHQSKQYIEDVNEELNEWREQAESLLLEKEQLERELQLKNENMLLLTSSSSISKNDLEKLEANQKGLFIEIDDLRDRNKDLEEELDGTKAECSQLTGKAEKAEKEIEKLVETVQQLEEEKEDAEQKFEQQLKHVQQELLNQKKRVEELDEERMRAVGSSDSEKRKILEEANEQREKASAAQAQILTLEEKLSTMANTLSSEKLMNETLEKRVAQLQQDLEEIAAHAETSSSSEARAEELEMQNYQLKENVRKLENELKQNELEITTRVAVLEKQIENLKSSNDLSDVEKRDLLEKIEEAERMERKVTELEAKLAANAEKQQQSMLNLKNMTELLEKESKRCQEATQEKRRFKEKAEEAERLLSEARENPQQGDENLITENARLVSELMTVRSQEEESRETLEKTSKEYEDKIRDLNNQVTARMEEINRKNVLNDKKRKDEYASLMSNLQRVESEKARLQDRIDEMYSSNHLAPSRRVSNMSAITNFSEPDFTDISDVNVLRKHIDKQQRLIIVLRRKCQGLLGK